MAILMGGGSTVTGLDTCTLDTGVGGDGGSSPGKPGAAGFAAPTLVV